MSGHLTDVLVIEDEDGFTTEWPFPDQSSLLRQGDFIEMCQVMHDARRAGVEVQ